MEREIVTTLKNYRNIRNALIQHSEEIKSVIRSEISTGLEKGEQLTISFDEWTSGANMQFINLIVYQNIKSFNLGLIKVDKAANAINSLEYIRKRLAVFGLIVVTNKYLIADGASVN